MAEGQLHQEKSLFLIYKVNKNYFYHFINTYEIVYTKTIGIK